MNQLKSDVDFLLENLFNEPPVADTEEIHLINDDHTISVRNIIQERYPEIK